MFDETRLKDPCPIFTLKPYSLSQHTVNFNTILEQVRVPKIDPLELVKPLENTIKNGKLIKFREI
jgi:hypothetical protein